MCYCSATIWWELAQVKKSLWGLQKSIKERIDTWEKVVERVVLKRVRAYLDPGLRKGLLYNKGVTVGKSCQLGG